MVNEIRKQEPSQPDNWLYQDWDENTRIFTKEAYLGVNDTEWPECTDAEKRKWEEDHPQPEPEPEGEQ